MSNSYKKISCVKIKGYIGKKKANQIIRRTNKQRLKSGKTLKDFREIVNRYDIVDWKWIETDPNSEWYKKFKRK